MHFFATFFWKAYTTNQQKNAIICGQSFACKKNVFEQHTRQTKKKMNKMQNCNILLPRFMQMKGKKGGGQGG